MSERKPNQVHQKIGSTEIRSMKKMPVEPPSCNCCCSAVVVAAAVAADVVAAVTVVLYMHMLT